MDDKQVFRSLKKRTYSKNNKQNWGGGGDDRERGWGKALSGCYTGTGISVLQLKTFGQGTRNR